MGKGQREWMTEWMGSSIPWAFNGTLVASGLCPGRSVSARALVVVVVIENGRGRRRQRVTCSPAIGQAMINDGGQAHGGGGGDCPHWPQNSNNLNNLWVMNSTELAWVVNCHRLEPGSLGCKLQSRQTRVPSYSRPASQPVGLDPARPRSQTDFAGKFDCWTERLSEHEESGPSGICTQEKYSAGSSLYSLDI